jgi:hypothetical protein
LTVAGDEELKLMSATLIRTLARGGNQTLPLFWPANTLGYHQITKFPLSGTESGTEWVEGLNAFMDDVFSQNAQVNR